jgi:hypothetical protein
MNWIETIRRMPELAGFATSACQRRRAGSRGGGQRGSMDMAGL